MAQQDPGQPATETSYSDPIYDRLESISQTLSKRWPLVLTIFVLAVACGLLLQQQQQSTPEAASASRFLEASGDQEQLKTFLGDDGESSEFRGRAAMELAQYAINAGDGAAAKDFADQGLMLVAPDKAGLVASLRLSKVAGLRAEGKFDEALQELRDIERSSAALPAHKLQAAIGQAEIFYQQAQADGLEGAARDELLKQALTILEPLQFGSDPAQMDLRQVASYLFHRIRFEHPALKSPSEELMVDTDLPADGAAPAAEAVPAVDPAPAAPVESPAAE